MLLILLRTCLTCVRGATPMFTINGYEIEPKFFACASIYSPTLCVQAFPLQFAYAISTKISWTGTNGE